MAKTFVLGKELCNNITGHVMKLDLSNPFLFDNQRYLMIKIVLHFSSKWLGGDISPSLLNLKHFLCLDLSINSFSRIQIPAAYSYLKNLEYLNLVNAGFGDSIPTILETFKLAYLQVGYAFRVSDYGLTVDSLRWVDGLSSLKSLDLSGWNNFNSTIPLWLSNATSLKQLQLDHNSFNVSIPDNLEKFTSLAVHDLSSNFFGIQLPNSFCKLTSLVHMDLNGNNFQGTIPYCFKNLTSLAILNLEANYLEGPIPDSISQMCSLKVPDLSLNQFNSLLPTLIRDPSDCLLNSLKELNPEVLHLSFNSLSGTIPSELGSLSHLRELDISNNKFNGSVPSSIGQLLELVKLEISNNSLSGEVSENMYSRIDDLELSHNSISGRLPKFEEYNDSFRVINLNSNKFKGTITYAPLGAYLVDPSENSLEGQLPLFDSYLNLSLTRLLLFDNHFTGEISPSLCEIQSLIIVNLSSNQLSGKIPSCLANLQNLHNLRILDIGDNGLNDIIHPWIGNLWDLMFLRFHSNCFHSTIPLQLCQLNSLKVLILSKNNLSGSIPHCRELKYSRSLQFLKTIELSENSIPGQIPEEIMKLIGLQNLNLSGNCLQGRIHDRIGNLKQIESLDLSRNKLSGPIPPCLSTLNSLSSEPNNCEIELELSWFYAGLGPGFGFGFMIVCCILVFKKPWRAAPFQFL
ncbi:unnamed protein product [Coffea canephora]|uniref:Leucine-rich repeat-containing N-terminal plant-type domain-containing protein n=1 Tax=Coffea canephora TaxID=49390 RepID=A0A068V729_COFCA|nr:unnamed protein product [Coffea canephora]